MAKPLKGQMHQVLFTMVDKTDGLSVESGVTSDFTTTFIGVNTGGSTAASAGSISKAISVVSSGVFKMTLKGAENNYDQMMAKIIQASCADQILVWHNDDVNNNDIYLLLSDVNSDLSSQIGLMPTTAKLLAYVQLLARGDESIETDNASELAEINSDMGSGAGSFVNDRDALQAIRARGDLAWLTGAGACATSSYTEDTNWVRTTGDSDGGSPSDTVSVDGNTFDTGETNAGVYLQVDVVFDITDGEVGSSIDIWGFYNGGAAHYIQVQALDVDTSEYEPIGSIPQGTVVTKYSFDLSPGHTDLSNDNITIRFLHQGGTGNPSHVFSVDKAQVNTRVPLTSTLGPEISNIYSMLSDHDSNIQSRVSKEVASASLLLDVHSDLSSQIGDITASVSASDMSDIASRVQSALGPEISNIYSLLSDHDSNMQSRVPKEVASASLLSDVNSDLSSQIGGITASVSESDMSDIASRVQSALGPEISNIYSLLSDHDSDITSQIGGIGGQTGPGSTSYIITIQDGSGNPITGAEVWISTDQAGSTVVAGTLVTNDSGQVTFLLDSGVTYYAWRDSADYNFTNPQQFTVP